MLGDTCEVLVSRDWLAAHPDLTPDLAALDYGQTIDPGLADQRIVADLLRSLPLDLPGLLASPLAVRDGDRLPPPIDRRYVHKQHIENVLLSQAHGIGRLWHFNLLPETAELRFDHGSEHVQGLLILEAMRQASLAAGHLIGLPLQTAMTLLNYEVGFTRYLNGTAPILLRSYAFFANAQLREDKPGFVINQAFQWGSLCATAVTSAYLFTDTERYSAHRQLAARLMTRGARGFERRLSVLAAGGVPQ